MAIEVLRRDRSAAELRKLARSTKDTRQARRLLSLALVLDGVSREGAARAGGMDRQTLRDWVHRYNCDGPEGLMDRPRCGRPPALDEHQLGQLDAIVEEGPDIAVHKVVRWRCADLKDVIKDRFDVEMSERHVGRLIKVRGFRRLSARPRHPKADQAVQSAFKKTLRRR
jgi:transposase